MKDYYEILGMGNNATCKQIDKAFKVAYKKWQRKGDWNKLNDVREAYNILHFPKNRQMYDTEYASFTMAENKDEYIIKNPELSIVINRLQENIKSNNDGVMKPMSIGHRLTSTIVDKVFILLIFVVTAMAFCSGRPGSELGIFVGELSSEYNKIESTKSIYESNKEVDIYLGYTLLTEDIEDYEYEKSYMDIYQKYVFIMILINLLYYLMCELLFKASLGKRIMGCEVRKEDGTPMGWKRVFIRAGVLGLFLVLAALIQPYLNVNGWIVSVLFFIALDFTVPFKNQSLIDLGTDTIVFKKSVKRAI